MERLTYRQPLEHAGADDGPGSRGRCTLLRAQRRREATREPGAALGTRWQGGHLTLLNSREELALGQQADTGRGPWARRASRRMPALMLMRLMPVCELCAALTEAILAPVPSAAGAFTRDGQMPALSRAFKPQRAATV